MEKKYVISAVAILIILVAGAIAYSSGPIVSAQGTSNIQVKPDQVSVNILVQTTNESLQDAQEANQEISEKLLIELVRAGFDRDELEFVNYNSYPNYIWDGNKQTQKGYIVSQSLVVKTDKTSEVPAIVDAAINAGALVSYIQFEVSEEKQNDYKNQALEAASKDARLKAESIAAGQGRGLGRLVAIQNQELPYFGPMMYYDGMVKAEAGGSAASDNAASARQAAMSITPTTQTISATIVAQYRLRFF